MKVQYILITRIVRIRNVTWQLSVFTGSINFNTYLL